MIRVHMLENRQGICGFLCEGHAGYAQQDENDVVCAAITAISGTTTVSITDLVQAQANYSFRPGRLECVVEEATDAQREQLNLLLQAFRLGCVQIELSYGSEYVHVEERTKLVK